MAAFSRTSRALAAETSRRSTAGLILAAALLAAWVAWFFLGQVALSERSLDARLTQARIVAARFPAESFARIRPGQQARVRLAGFPAPRYPAIPAVVTRAALRGGYTEAIITIDPSARGPIPLQPDLAATVEVPAERASPADVLLRALAAGGM